MKYNDNGTYKDIYVKTFDTLPVGAIVEYTGATIPSGWTDIGNNQIQKTSQYIEGGLSISDIYPVGSIYISVNNVNPSTLFGGTWEQIKDTFLLSAGDTYTAGSTGGSAKKTIAQNNLPGRTVVQTNVSSNTAVATFTSSSTWNMHCLSDSSSETYGQQLDIMPPYLTVYMWKRTA